MLPAYAGRTHASRTRSARQGAGHPDAPGRRHRRRRQDFHQARSARQPRRQGRCAGHRRRHGQHVPAAQGTEVGKSLASATFADTARDIIDEAENANCDIVLPVDAVVAQKFEANAPSRVVDIDACRHDDMILDIGPRSVEHVVSALDAAKTLVWNGPLGAFEMRTVRSRHRRGGGSTRRNSPRPASWSRSPAAAIRWRHSIRPASPTISPMFRRPAAPSWNGWKASRLPGVEVLRIK